MRIVYLITRADTIGGGQQHVADLASGMTNRGHEVWVLHGPGRALPQRLQIAPERIIEVADLTHHPLSPMKDRRALNFIHERFKQLRPDVVAVHSTKAGILGRLASSQLKLPCVYTLHGVAYTRGVKPHRRILGLGTELLFRHKAARFIAVSEYDRDLAVKFRAADKDRITVVYNAVPDLPATLITEQSEQPNYDRVKIVSVARLDQQKDHATLLDAVSAMQTTKSWSLELVGDGPLAATLEKQALELGIADRVTFSGLVSDVANRLQKSDLFVLSTNYEGLPISLIEAARAGLPLIATDVGGVSEIVKNGQNGLLTERSSAVQLGRAITRMVDNASERERYGKCARETFTTLFGFDQFISMTEREYLRSISQFETST